MINHEVVVLALRHGFRDKCVADIPLRPTPLTPTALERLWFFGESLPPGERRRDRDLAGDLDEHRKALFAELGLPGSRDIAIVELDRFT